MFKLTIITINYNNREGLKKTIESVVSQITKSYEYIIIDGGSTDGSIDIIKKYQDKIDYWVSEPDTGIYNAMNKGVALAHGEFCQFLNSGDWLYNEFVIDKILAYLDNRYDIITGYIYNYHNNCKSYRNYLLTPNFLTLYYLIDYSISHPSSFIKRSILLLFPYNEQNKIVSDWEFFVNCYINGNKFAYIPLDIAYYDMSGISTNIELSYKEKREVIKQIDISYVLDEIRNTPPEIVQIFNTIPYSYRLKQFLCVLVKFIVNIYCRFKKIKKKKLQYTKIRV